MEVNYVPCHRNYFSWNVSWKKNISWNYFVAWNSISSHAHYLQNIGENSQNGSTADKPDIGQSRSKADIGQKLVTYIGCDQVIVISKYLNTYNLLYYMLWQFPDNLLYYVLWFDSFLLYLSKISWLYIMMYLVIY